MWKWMVNDDNDDNDDDDDGGGYIHLADSKYTLSGHLPSRVLLTQSTTVNNSERASKPTSNYHSPPKKMNHD